MKKNILFMAKASPDATAKYREAVGEIRENITPFSDITKNTNKV
jgi:hypothetical protein